MKQIAQNYKSGELGVVQVPRPLLRPEGILVRNVASLISAGTEKTKVDTAQMSLLGKARSRPDQVKKVLETLKKEGVANTYRKVMGKLDSLTPLGYSCAGVVVAVGAKADGFRIGDRVACAGAGYANHAEAVYVPKNLAVKIPDGVGFDAAAYATVGAIALQGLRQADLRLGECVAVIGLGLIGQLTVQLLKASGCRVLGIDLDPSSVALARANGADVGGVRGVDDVEALAAALSGGYGLDAVLITAGTRSNDPIELAPRMLRERGRVVVVGAVGMGIPRDPYYMKELDLRLSRSYGPGRYDPDYEEKGLDYPYGHVRWTENRNMGAFLTLIAEKRLDLERLTTHRFNVDRAAEAYALIAGKRQEPYMGILLEYDAEPDLSSTVPLSAKAAPKSQPGVSFLGAGSFAKSTILPVFRKPLPVVLRGIQTATGLTASDIGTKYGFAFAAATPEAIIEDRETDAVVITTRHDTHAPLTIQALQAGKAVFVEKPLALTESELDDVLAVAREASGRLLVGFNRRFAPMTREVLRRLAGNPQPRAIQMRINAGEIPRDHWIHDPAQGGGRVIGEVCHFIDLAQVLAGAPITRVYAEAMRDPASGAVIDDVVSVSLRHENGALSSIAYFANGDTSHPKERIEVFAGGEIAIIEDFRRLTHVRRGKTDVTKAANQDKGHEAELRAFVESLVSGAPMPIPLESLENVMRATLKAVDALKTGEPQTVQP